MNGFRSARRNQPYALSANRAGGIPRKIQMKTKTKTKTTKNKVIQTDFVFVLDRSGSMKSNKAETIEGFNEYVDQLKKGKASKEARFTMVQFDTQGIESLYKSAPVKDIKPLTDETFVPRGGTPLIDAVGITIQSIAEKKDVQFCILTDGEENSSREYTLDSLKKLMKECESKKGWTFSFIAMGPDSWHEVQRLSAGTMSFSNVLNINKNKKDIKRAFRAQGQSAAVYAYAISSGDEALKQNLVTDWFSKKGKRDKTS